MLSLDDAVRMHGHKGPWLVLGYRAGLRALEVLKPEDEHDLVCTVKCPLRTPYTCSIDGIQASTGCTLGKMSIRIEENDAVEFVFSNKKGLLRLRVRDHVLEKIKSILSSKGMSSASDYVERAEFNELFEES
ncbi:MAG: formylmethanofuran dehydrogenase subunit E family protein [Archaeoglobaceae archaeon]